MSIWETRDREVGVRPPLGGLPRLDTSPGTVFFVVVMIGTVTFDGFSQGQLWTDLSVDLVDALDGIVGARDGDQGRRGRSACSPASP